MPCYISHYNDINSIGKLNFSLKQCIFTIVLTPRPIFCTTLAKPYNVNYVCTYLLVYHYCYYYYADYSDFVKCIMFIYSSLCT